MDIALIGYGAMGKMVRKKAKETGHHVTVIVNESHAGLAPDHLSETLRASDVAIDFTNAAAVERNIEACMIAGIPIVEGTTGWDDKRDAVRELVEARDGAMVYGANFSLGVNAFYKVIERAAEIMSHFPGYEAFIEEQHHSRKKDAPSGTALKLKEILGNFLDPDLSIAATRAGNIPGTHRVGFDGAADQILITHTARSREGFARGAIVAAEWIAGKKGVHEFSEVIGDMLANGES